ncbi:cytochrome b5-like Heme/Steroid binding domain-containing protein [Colletotrichum salicis]|uniref:Cytochrome b5-like Heme/Steroid binding domain-containing protein n=1 Tax=Colletotrichum salicis TaxID=1209931 RepID=A0A135V0N3_9PEZI|nr:cytochrome b5-like Heme/Steroid binding domain-containing protein [Colletotrichum salicis]
MADDAASVRQRKRVEEVDSDGNAIDEDAPAVSKGEKKSKKSKKDKTYTDEYSPYLDILRLLSFFFLASCALSYLQSGGESFFWGQKNKPWYMKPSYWKAKWVRNQPFRSSPFTPPPNVMEAEYSPSIETPKAKHNPTQTQNGPLYLTPEELLQYDGTDPSKPIYLAINHTIFDVSANPRIYGPGGSYNVFAGRDASRGFVTGCFVEDRTPDMRGVEDMFLPLDDPDVDRHWSYADMQALQAEERAAAEKKVHDALKHWVDFFSKSDKYGEVGRVKREDGWLEKEKRRPLCEQAQKGRVKRVVPGQEKN